MFKELLGLYEAGLINRDTPKCLFPETLIFNEGWLLRSVLKGWIAESEGTGFGFLPFPPGATGYSEGQLYTPFRRGSHREGNTHVDGIVGDFSITETKSGIVLKSNFRYIAAFEAKIFGRISPGVTNAPDFDQTSRTAACLINSILLAEPKGSYSAHLVIVYAEDNRYIDPDLHTRDYVEKQITKRLQGFLKGAEPGDTVERFASGWRDVLGNLGIHSYTWEQVLANIGSDDLVEFYDLCKRFNA